MKFPINIHIHIHRFCVDIHGYIHIHRCLSCIDVSTDCPQSTVGFYCLLELKIYKRKNKMFAFDETKEYVFIKCTYLQYMYFLVHVINIYTVFQKKVVHQLISITQSILNGFSKFLHLHTLWKIWDKRIIKDFTTPKTCRCTTL